MLLRFTHPFHSQAVRCTVFRAGYLLAKALMQLNSSGA